MFDVNSISLTTEEAHEILNRCNWCRDGVDIAGELSEYGCVWDSDGEALYWKAFWIIHKHYTFGVCAGRHKMPVNDFVFDEVVDPTDSIGLYNQAYRRIPQDAEHIDLYITGLTPATLAVVAVCVGRGISLTAYNYNRETAKYVPQRVLC